MVQNSIITRFQARTTFPAKRVISHTWIVNSIARPSANFIRRYKTNLLFAVMPGLVHGPQGFGRSGENDYLFSGGWRALVIIFRDLGSKLIVLGF